LRGIKTNLIDMDRAEEILKEQLKIDKAVGFGKLMWELHKNTIKKCMQIYVEEQLLLHNVSQQRELLLFFLSKINKDAIDLFNEGKGQIVINYFLKNNNCG
jgi:hypothetical protein